jgi:uncharacterized protein (DUF2147 family)
MRLVFVLLAQLIVAVCYAQSTPEGLWMSYDDDGKTPSAIVRISQSGSQLVGRIEKVLDPQSELNCSKCNDDRRHQPLVGLEIIRGVKSEPNNGRWEQGKILDPDDGAEYKLVIEMQNSGKTLLVRGYWGLFWRSQKWQRQ